MNAAVEAQRQLQNVLEITCHHRVSAAVRETIGMERDESAAGNREQAKADPGHEQRDEVRDGRTLRTAVERGWKRARRTVLVSDTVSFLAAALLWYFSIGEVKGFAFTLGLTTIIDVIVVFLFTKPMVTLLAGTKFFSSGNKWSGLDPDRLGAKTPWRSGRRTVRSSRTGTTGTGRTRAGGNSSTTSKEA